MAVQLPKKRGLLFSNTKISKPDLLSEDQYLKWYLEDHIPEVADTSGVASASFYVNLDPSSVDKPYLAIYDLPDLSFLASDEFRKIRVHSDLLPGGGPCYDFMDVDVRYYEEIQEYNPTNSKFGHGVSILTAAGTPSEEIASEFDSWYREEHLQELAKVPGYLRSSRYTLKYSRTNAQSRVLKGLATPEEIEEAKKLPDPPIHLAIHEFDRVELDMVALKATIATEWTKKVQAEVTKADKGIWKLREVNSRSK